MISIPYRSLASFGLLLLGACTTLESSTDRQAGFLTDYDRLRPDEVGGNSWARPGIDLSQYDAAFVPPVELWVTDDVRDELDAEDAARLCGLFRAKVLEKFGEHGWKITSEPGPRVCTVRMALTELEGANPYGNIVTSLPYQTTTAIQVLALTADVHFFVGQASTEVQVVDSATGEVLAEGLDKRVGAHSVWNIGSTWGDVEDAMDVWADRIAEGLSKLVE